LLREEEEKFIDHRFSRQLIIRLTGIRGADLEAYMAQYRPSLWFVQVATDYELGMYIKECFVKFQQMRARQNPDNE
jgi:hypothetical protein